MILDTQKGKLIAAFHCEEGDMLTIDKFYCSEGTSVKETPIGKYWETNGDFNSEFGFRFHVENVNKPHLLRFRYPDDKKRYMAVSDCLGYDYSTAISTGGVYPFSNEIKTVEMIVWPRMEWSFICFVTMNEGNPAALTSMEIYELEELPKGPELPVCDEYRTMGIQFEDPCGRCDSLGAKSYREWNEKMIAYMKASGQNELCYPVNWYHGPQYPSKTQPADMCESFLEANGRMFSRVTTMPTDWVEEILTEFDKNDLFFNASFTLVRLGTLLQNMQIDEEAIKAGADTYNNMRYDNRVQNAINDWTALYNARNYKKLLKRAKETDNVMRFGEIELAWGEWMTDVGVGPMFNPIHPIVQNTVKEYLVEFAQRYKGHKSLRCMSINVWHSSLLWFADLRFGYDDYTVGLFEKENGIDLGIEKRDRERFSRRYEALTKKHKERWIEWRCEKITQFIKELVRTIREVNPNIKVCLTYWNEMVKPSVLGMQSNWQLYARPNDYEFLRMAGMDIQELGKIEGVEISIESNHQRDITNLFTRNGNKAPMERGFMYRDHDFMDDARTEAHKNCLYPTSFIFNCWEESWGHSTVHQDFSLSELSYEARHYDDGSTPESIHEAKSSKHHEQFWGNWQVVIVAAFPPAPYYMEYYAHSVADIDALSITSGGLYLDTSHTEELAAFAKEYRNLPAVKFEDVAGMDDPVTVRYKTYKGQTYIYAVNKSPVNTNVRIELDRLAKLCRPATNEELQTQTICTSLAPFEMKVYVTEGEVMLESCVTEVNDEKAGLLISLGKEALEDLNKTSLEIKGIDETKKKIKVAIDKKKYALIYHILTGYVVNKIREE